MTLHIKALHVLQFLRVADDDGISLTNLGVMLCLAKLALVTNAGLPDIAALFLALLAHGHAAFRSDQVAGATAVTDTVAVLRADLEKVQGTVASLQLGQAMGRRP